MRILDSRLFSYASFALIVIAFETFGERAGWRAAGIVQLIFSIKIFYENRIGVGWAGKEPSFYLTGSAAIFVGLISVTLAGMFIIVPEKTVMRWHR